MFFIIQEPKGTNLNFSRGNVRVFVILFCVNIISI